MLRVDLAVPYADRHDARQLGARWDPSHRVWFVPPNRDASPFVRWLPAASPINVRAASHFIAAGTLECWRCQGRSAVHGFALPAGHETSLVDEETGEVTWEVSEEPTLVCYLEFASAAAIERMRLRTPNFRLAMRNRTRSCYWANFCEYCGTKLGDYDVFCEPGQGLMPLTGEEAASILLEPVTEPFAATAGGWSLGVELFEFMTLLG